MSVKYIDLRKERHQEQMKSLEIGKQVNNKIAQKMHNYENNIEEDLDLDEKDPRSNYEKSQDINQIRQQIGAKLNKIFKNDPHEVNTFMEFINHNNIGIQDFNSVYPELLKNIDPNTNTASYMIPKMINLMENKTALTNQSSILNNVYNLIKTIYENGTITKTKADDLVDKSEALLKQNSSNDAKMSNLVKKSDNMTRSEISKELEQLFSKSIRPRKQPEPSSNVKGTLKIENWDTATDVSQIKNSFKLDDIKQILKKEGETYTGNKNELATKLFNLI